MAILAVSYLGYVSSMNQWTERLVTSEGLAVMPIYPNDTYPSWLYYEVSPGETIHDTFYVRNFYDHPAEVEVGFLDTEFGSSLQYFALSDQFTEQNEIGVWATMDGGEKFFTLEPDEYRLLDFTLTVPEDTPYGQYLGGAFADYVPEGQTGAIVNVLKTGLRIILEVKENPASVARGESIEPYLSNRVSILHVLPYSHVSVVITLLALMLILFSQTKEFSKLTNSTKK